MKKVWLLIILTVISTSVCADWKQFGGSDDLDLYIDLTSKRKVGNKVKMWLLHDLKTPEKSPTGKDYLSVVAQQEYDCANETSKLLQLTYYSGNMQNGNSLDIFTYLPGESKPTPITPNTLQETSWRVACVKK